MRNDISLHDIWQACTKCLQRHDTQRMMVVRTTCLETQTILHVIAGLFCIINTNLYDMASTLLNSIIAPLKVGGRTCDVLATRYPNQLLVIVTCTGTLGTILQASSDHLPEQVVSVKILPATSRWFPQEQQSLFDVATLLGKRGDPAHDLCCRRLAEELHQAGYKERLQLCLGLPVLTLDDVRQLVPALLDIVRMLQPSEGAVTTFVTTHTS